MVHISQSDRWHWAWQHTEGFKAWKRELVASGCVALVTWIVWHFRRGNREGIVDDLIAIAIAVAATVVLVPIGEFIWNYLRSARQLLSSELDTARNEIAGLKKQIAILREELSELQTGPSFVVQVDSVMVAPAGEGNKDAMGGAMGTISNLGAPGSVVNFWVDLKVGDQVINGVLPVAPEPKQHVIIGKSPSGGDTSLSGEKYWTRTATQLIATNDYANGWILAVFKGITKEEIQRKKATIVVTCSDVKGQKSSGERSFEDIPSIPFFGLGDIQAKQP